MNTVRLEHEGSLAIITLNRPEKRNAISEEMLGELPAALAQAAASPAVAAILTGEGKAFCAGMDLETLKSSVGKTQGQNLEDARRMAQMFLAVYRFPKPLIAAVNGPAIAGGCGLATMCDFTLAVPEAMFGYTEVRIGFAPAMVSVFLVRQIGEKRARDLLLTGRVVDAEEARRLGLVNEVIPADKLMSEARELGASLAANSPTSLMRLKKLLDSFNAAELDRQLELAIAESAAIRGTPDFGEGVAAYLEMRTPNWGE